MKMKKLMFAIAAAVMAVGAQANNVDWYYQLNSVPKSGADTSAYTAYFFDNSRYLSHYQPIYRIDIALSPQLSAEGVLPHQPTVLSNQVVIFIKSSNGFW